MKQLIFMSALTLASAMAGEATAACSGTQITDTAGTHETATATFLASTAAGQWVTIAGLTFTTTAARSNTIMASAFAGLSNGATTGPATAYGTYAGTFTGWTTGAAASNKVTFTNAGYGNVPDIGTITSASSNAIKPSSTTVNGTGAGISLGNLLTGNTVCVGSAGNWQAQEFHKSGGNLIDFKKGASDPVDPTALVGTWSITGTGTAARVNYTYGAPPTYNNAVWDHSNGTYSFCNQLGTETPVIYIKSGQVGC